MMEIRLERPGDQPGIYAVEEVAFGRTAEADVVARVRSTYPEEAFMVVELVPGAIASCQGTVYSVPDFSGV